MGIAIIGILIIIIFFLTAESSEQKAEREQKEKDWKINWYLESYNKAKMLFDQKKYRDAKFYFNQAADRRPPFTMTNDLEIAANKNRYYAHLCEFNLEEYTLSLKGFEHHNDEQAIICKAISAFQLGEYSLSEKYFIEGSKTGSKNISSLYKDYFNDNLNQQKIWNSFPKDLKYLLSENIKIDLSKNENLTLNDSEISKILELENLDLAKRKEDYSYVDGEFTDFGYYEGWMLSPSYRKHSITSLKFCYFFKNIKSLNISEQPIKSLEGLEKHINLKILNASYTKSLDLSLLYLFKNLTHLNLHCSTSSIKQFPLAPIIKMDLTKCFIYDFEQLNKLTTLVELSLYYTNIKSLNQIKDLSNLVYLNVSSCDNFSLTTDCNLNNLKELIIWKTTDDAKQNFLSKFPQCNIKEFDSNGDIFHRKPKVNPRDLSDLDDYLRSYLE